MNSQGDTAIVSYGCDAPTGASCPAIQARQTATADTAGTLAGASTNTVGRSPADPGSAPWISIDTVGGWGETAAATINTSVRSTVSFKAVQFSKAGTYTYTFFVKQNGTSAAVPLTTVSGTTVTWTVTVSAVSTSSNTLLTYFAPSNTEALYYRVNTPASGGAVTNRATSTDSAVTAVAGTAASPTLVGVLYAVPTTTAGDTRVALGDTYIPIQDTFVVTLTGPGYVSVAGATPTGKAVAAWSVASFGRDGVAGPRYQTESLTVYSDGTAGVGTLTVTKGSATVYTKTLTFTGTAASAGVSLSDTYTYIGGTLNIAAQVKDAAGVLLSSGTFYIMSSDTAVVSAGATLYSNAATQYQTLGRCGDVSGQWNVTTKVLTCSLTTADTGTASIYFADSWNVTASSFVTTAMTLTVTGNTIASTTVSFDKATYAPGERAVITITAKDVAGRVLATGATGTYAQVKSTPILSSVLTAPYFGTRGTTDGIALTSLSLYADSGVETRVVTMPTYGTDVSYTLRVPAFGVSGTATDVTASAKVVDPAQVAQDKAIADAQAAADAATDAALQAIDAANAATDAANLAAEAADAATVAAEEAKDAADAATAAVEALATQVATLMAALQAQVRSLANTVAKIAKKVKA